MIRHWSNLLPALSALTHWAVLVMLSSPALSAEAVAVVPAWNYRLTDADENNFHEASCASGQGRVAVITNRYRNSAQTTMQVLDLTPAGEARLEPLPALPHAAGAYSRVYDCAWVDGGDLLVLASTKASSLVAIWLAGDLSLEGWLALGPKRAEMQAWATAELSPGQYATVGHTELTAYALRFDREHSRSPVLPWEPGKASLFTDIAVNNGGFVACGVQGEAHDEPFSPESQLIVASFDVDGGLLASSRMRGHACALLSSRTGEVRLLHEDDERKPQSLRLARLDLELQPIASEEIFEKIHYLFAVEAVEADQAFVVLNRLYAFETLEIFRGSARVSFDPGMHPMWTHDLLGAGSRIYLVTRTIDRERSLQGVRVDAYDLSSRETTGP